MTFKSLLKLPSAYLPLALSLCALALVLVATQIFGAGHEPDEGTPAHLFQLLMVAQAPIILFFAVKWLPQDARQASRILALQIAAALVALAPVFIMHL
ncbi:MAG: hypothetical protein M3Y30_09925 [Gemmatimonadota bacterium]|nr:hypothetical protein [Gemmatimonadota bacterium]